MRCRKQVPVGALIPLLALAAPHSWAAGGSGEAAIGVVETIASFDATACPTLKFPWPRTASCELPEGVATDREGNVYVGMYTSGEIWKFTPDGRHSILAVIPVANVPSGGLVGFALDEDDDLYVCNATYEAGTHGIWRVHHDGSAELFAALDPNGFPNGLAFDGEGNLFVSDSYLGDIFKITHDGVVSVWFQSSLLFPNPNYGANNIAFDRGDLFVTNTDGQTIYRIHQEGEAPPQASVYAQSPLLYGADGISFDVRHNAYVASDYIDTLVRVRPSGVIDTLATHAANGEDFPADTAFGTAPKERKYLYWTNGGWNWLTPSLQRMNLGVPGARVDP